ncbi:MAG: sulfotransferase [Gammaproteobacteria bacterium]|jgi:tetratricopeptide (TPR) repeat protein|nr:sulfotransferase [Gammaproteobacteria bacterium]
MQADAVQTREFPVETGLARVRELAQRDDHTTALALLHELEQQHPHSGLLWQERGACYLALGDRPSAITAYQRAVQLNDALEASWAALKELYSSSGRRQDAEYATRCLIKISTLPRQLAHGSSLLNEGEVEAAEEVVRGYLRCEGTHAEGLRLLAQIGVRLGILDDAELLLENLLALAPEYDDARYEYAAVLTQRRRYFHALKEAQLLLRRAPGNPEWQLLYAKACDGLGEYQEAVRIYQQLLAAMPRNASLQLAIAHLLRTRGDSREAVEAFRAAAALPGGAGGAFLALANMKTYHFTDDEVVGMRAAESAPGISLSDRYHLCFALGKALEDRNEYAASFEYYERGNALRRSELDYKPDVAERNLLVQKGICTAEFLTARRGMGCPRPDPIFIVGLPRSGSTLIEQILSSHSQVDGTLELPEIPRLVKQFRNRRANGDPTYPAVLAELHPEDFRALGETYLEETRPYRRGAPFFIDKMPGNFRDIGFIHLILPNARIIDARRAAMACCFGNFKQLFVNGQEFTYNLTEMGRYYRTYVELMEHWNRALPGKVLRVQHEDVVNDLEGSVRRILEFCGLEFEPACLEFYKTERSVRTVSSEQVRRPIYREGIEQWRNFEPWLAPLKSALGPLV